METVLITGGTGLIGNHLCKKLQEKDYNIVLLSRNSNTYNNTYSNTPAYAWDPEKNEIDINSLMHTEYIIHLAGAGLGDKRWTQKRKQLIADSRIRTGELIFNKVIESGIKLKAFISASAIGYYGSITSEKIFRETDPPGRDFIAQVCRQCEQMADRFERSGIRTVKIRTGIVLSNHGGALSKMAAPVKLGIGSALGTGRQYMPWIHIEDLCNIYIRAIEDSRLSGAYNATAPEHRTNKDFMNALATTLGKPFFAPAVPSMVMKLLFGEMSGILLNGSRISSGKIIASGYQFSFPTLENALKNLFQLT